MSSVLLYVFAVYLCIEQCQCQGTASLTSSPSSLTGSLCPQVVAMTCSVGNIQHLRWFTSNFNTNAYAYSPGDESRVPIDIEASPPGVMIAVVSVSQSTVDADRFTALSTLNTTLSVFRDLDISSVYCGSSSNEVQSETIRVEFTILDAPLSPSGASCSVLSSSGGLSVVLELDPSFIMDYAVESYTVTVDPATSSCSNDQLSPNDRYSCTGLTVGTSYTFSISAVNCVDQIGATHTITVHPQSSSITSSITVVSTYTSSAESAELNKVLVLWEHEDQPVISESCSFNDELNYTVVLEDNETIIEQRVISSDSCVNGFCETFFVSTSSNSYVVHVTATNGIGLSSGTVESSTIERTIPFNFDVSFANCETSVLCSYNSMGNCTVQFIQNPDYQDLSEGTLGRLNSPFLLPLMEPTTTFYYQATVTINSSTTIQIRRNFTTGEFDVRLTSANLALLVLGVILLFVAIAGCVVLVVVQVRSDKGSRLSLVMLVVGVVIIVFSLVLWAAVMLQVLLQSNTCDSAWQGTRDNLIITAFVFSLLALLSLASAAMVLALAFNGKRRSNKDLVHKEGWEIQLYQHKDEMECDEIARRVKILEAPTVMANEFKETGEKRNQAAIRAGERLFQEYDSKPPPASVYDVAYPNTSEKVDIQDASNVETAPSEPSEEFKPPCVTMCKYSRFLLAGSKTPSPEEVKKVGEQVAAWFPKERKWSVEDLGADKRLKVYFDSKSEVISNEVIMELLEDSWKGCFIAHLNKKDCNIRVTFQDSSADGSWSALGCEAKHTPKSKPTMVLNFKAMNEDEVKTTVLHQFGHALGLGHALMKPDKWEVLKPYLKIGEMMRSYGSPNIDTFEVQWTGKNMNMGAVNYDPGSIMHSRYSTNPEWLKVQSEKLSSDAQKQISIFKKYSTPQNQLSKNDLKVLDFEVIRPAFTLKDLESLENKASNETFHLTAKLAPSWRTVGENLGLTTDILDKIGDSKSTDEGMLTAVWYRWFNRPEDFPEHPLTRKGLRKLLESCDKETAKQFFVFLDNKVC